MMKYLLIGILTSVCGLAQAQWTAPVYSNEFMSLPMGARALGMGKSQVAATSGAEAGYWNPSYLLELTSDHNISMMHNELYGGVASLDFISYATTLDSTLAVGFTAIRLGVDDIPDTRLLYDAGGRIDYNNISFFSAADYGFLFSLAKYIPRFPSIRLGANVKIIHRKAGDFASAWGFGLDLGAHYVRGNWDLAFMGRDITGTFNAWSHSSDLVNEVYQSTGNTLPDNSVEITLPKWILGVRYKLLQREQWQLMTTADLDLSFDGKRNVLLRTPFMSVDPSLGMEMAYSNRFFVRAGMAGTQQTDMGWQSDPHFGLGLRLSWAGIDYAFSRLQGLSDGSFTHSFSLNLFIDEKK